MEGANDHTFIPWLNRDDSESLPTPALAVSEMVGKKVGARRADVGVGAQQIVLGLLNVRTTQQRAGADARRDQRDGVVAQALQRDGQQVLGTVSPASRLRRFLSCVTSVW